MEIGYNSNAMFQERINYLNQIDKSGIKAGQRVSGNDTKKTTFEDDLIKNLDEKFNGAPYGFMAEDGAGFFEYNGVTFGVDNHKKVLSLGDISDEKNTLTIPLSGGGTLKVNRNNFDELAKAIGMFSPEDVKRIMQAMAQDAKARTAEDEVEEEKNNTYGKMVDGQAGVTDAKGTE